MVVAAGSPCGGGSREPGGPRIHSSGVDRSWCRWRDRRPKGFCSDQGNFERGQGRTPGRRDHPGSHHDLESRDHHRGDAVRDLAVARPDGLRPGRVLRPGMGRPPGVAGSGSQQQRAPSRVPAHRRRRHRGRWPRVLGVLAGEDRRPGTGAGVLDPSTPMARRSCRPDRRCCLGAEGELPRRRRDVRRVLLGVLPEPGRSRTHSPAHQDPGGQLTTVVAPVALRADRQPAEPCRAEQHQATC